MNLEWRLRARRGKAAQAAAGEDATDAASRGEAIATAPGRGSARKCGLDSTPGSGSGSVVGLSSRPRRRWSWCARPSITAVRETSVRPWHLQHR